ncbi:hypothetical protein HMPREF9996_00058 [Aggregatibacter actinomycetemcomitans Y4]|nr:hypothetical protein HMPREF9996_00058 [Aggregatibacter actinomycetemcomitans Y4]
MAEFCIKIKIVILANKYLFKTEKCGHKKLCFFVILMFNRK